MKFTLQLLIVYTCLVANIVWSADIVRDINVGREDVNDRGGYLELGASLEYVSQARLYDAEDYFDEREGVIPNVVAGFAYYHKPFFIEAAAGSFDGLNLGVNVHRGERWSVDLLLASIYGSIILDEDSDTADEPPSEADRNKTLLQRDTLYSGMGVRGTLYTGDYITQVRLVNDVYDAAGFTGTLRVGRSWLLRNWNIHSIVSAEYNSADTNNYLYGVNTEEATARFPVFESSSGFSYAAEIGASYPLSRNWVYRSFVRYRHLSDEISSSPLVVQPYDAQIFNALLYVF